MAVDACVRCCEVLRSKGPRPTRYRMRHLMCKNSLRALCRRYFIHITENVHALPISDNMLARRFNPSRSNQAAVVLDLRVWGRDHAHHAYVTTDIADCTFELLRHRVRALLIEQLAIQCLEQQSAIKQPNAVFEKT